MNFIPLMYVVAGLVTAAFGVGLYLALTISPHAVTWVVAAAFNVYLAVFVFHRNRSSSVNRTFALLSLAIAIWCLNAFELYLVPDAAWAARLSRIFVVGTLFVPPLFFHFVLHLTCARNRLLDRLLLLSYTLSAAFLGLDLAGLFVHDYVRVGWKFTPRPEPLYVVWLINAAFWLLFSLVQVFRSYRQAHSYKVRAQLRYFFLASFLGIFFHFGNYLVTFGVAVYPLGGVFTSVYMAIVAYSIVKYQLMDINVIIRRSIIYAALTLAVAGIYALVVGVITAVLGVSSTIRHGWVINGFAGAIVAAVFLPLRNKIQYLVDKIFFREKYNYRQTLREFSREVTSILNADVLAEMLVTKITETMHIDRAFIMVFDLEKNDYRMLFQQGMEGTPASSFCIERSGALVRRLEHNKNILVYAGEEAGGSEFEALGIVIAVPLLVQDTLVGVLFLGQKKSEEVYTEEDRELLMTLVNQAAISVKNAELSAKMRSLEKSLYQADKLSALGTFASSVAHEIKNPLASIKTFCQLVSRRFDDQHFVVKFNDIVPGEIERLEGVLGQLLDFGKFSGVQMVSLKIEKVIDDLMNLVHYEASKSKVKIVRNYAVATPPVTVCEEQMKQVFMNLILNAIQAMPDGGEIVIGAGTRTKEGGKEAVCVTVTDTGCGIARESMDRIFKPFFTTRQTGTGLGLSITRKIIQEHGGTIEVQSELHKGTTFTVYLPCGTSSN